MIEICRNYRYLLWLVPVQSSQAQCSYVGYIFSEVNGVDTKRTRICAFQLILWCYQQKIW